MKPCSTLIQCIYNNDVVYLSNDKGLVALSSLLPLPPLSSRYPFVPVFPFYSPPTPRSIYLSLLLATPFATLRSSFFTSINADLFHFTPFISVSIATLRPFHVYIYNRRYTLNTLQPVQDIVASTKCTYLNVTHDARYSWCLDSGSVCPRCTFDRRQNRIFFPSRFFFSQFVSFPDNRVTQGFLTVPIDWFGKIFARVREKRKLPSCR